MQNLTETKTGHYEPTASAIASGYGYGSARGEFQRYFIPVMLRHPHVKLALRLIKGRIIARAKFLVEESDPTLKRFLVNQVTRFWMFSASRCLNALEWGYSGSEALFEVIDGLYEFRMLKNFHAFDALVVTNSLGEKVGVKVLRGIPNRRGHVYLGGPKSFWHVQGREMHPWYGSSILEGAFDPWFESWKDGGARDIRNLYFYKYAFTGDSLYYPTGAAIGEDLSQNYILNRDVAREIVEKRRTGGVATFPNDRDEEGNRSWEWVPASTGPGSAPILEYNDHLKTEILEGIGVPREVVEASETGSGYSGRKVPMEGFDSMLQEMVNWLILDFNEQILEPLVKINFGISPRYRIFPFGLSRDNQREEQPETSDIPMSLPFPRNLQTDEFGIVYYR